jgi:tetratricopeptide (TPR) repeat protein
LNAKRNVRGGTWQRSPFSPCDPRTGTSTTDQSDWSPNAGAKQVEVSASEVKAAVEKAIEVYRALLFSGQCVADDHFSLAEMLYLQGDLAGARERYYMAIELDEDFVEARSNLGCVLVEEGQLELAEAAFRGALEYHCDYADAHFHLARLLDRMNHPQEAAQHWQQFLKLAPASPWADEADERIEAER